MSVPNTTTPDCNAGSVGDTGTTNMGKPNLSQKDLYERINYLYQACNTVLEHNPNNRRLASFYGHVMSNVAKRGVIKLDPSIKRTICKTCNMLLIPGLTSTFRIRGKRQLHVVITCKQCKTLKRFVCNPAYKLWSEQPNAETKEEKRPNVPATVTDADEQLSEESKTSKLEADVT